MTEILAQIHLLESKVERLGLPSDSALQVYRYYEQELFCHQGWNDSLYLTSYQYYLHDLERMEKIYEGVVDSLSLWQRLERLD